MINEAKENDASLLPGKKTERTLIDPWAASSEAVVMYSLKNIGASVTCSANVRNVETAAPRNGLVTVLPPNKA